MRGKTGETEATDVAGVYFEIEELQRVLAMRDADLRVEVVSTNVAYEEVVLFRRGGSPAPIVATLHKSPDGTLVLTRLDDARLATPGARTAYPTLDATLPALRRTLRV